MNTPAELPERVPDDCRVYRLIKPDWVKVEDGRERPSSQAFASSKQDGAMSVGFEDQLAAEGATLEDLLKKMPGYRLCWFTAGELRDDFGQELFRDPKEDFPGHGGVRHPGGKNRPPGIRTKMAIRARWHEEES